MASHVATHERLYRGGLLAAFAIGAAVRTFHALRAGFPLNDGGLFYQMVRDLQAAHYQLPAFTTYNQIDLPFAYPPLGFYIAGLVDDLTPFDLFTVFRLLPLLYCLLTLGAVYLLARRFSSTPLALAVAVAAFGLVPRGFIWLLMGGGVTRALGLLLAILALRQVHLLYTTGRLHYLWTTIPLAGLTVLAHLETGAFLAFSIVVFWLFLGRSRRGATSSLLLALGTAGVVSPWLITLLARHGVDPLLGAMSSSSSILSGGETTEFVLVALARIVWTSEAFFPIIGVLGVVGAVVAISRGQYLLPAWWATIILLDARAFHTFSCIPIAILAGQAVETIAPRLMPPGGSAPGIDVLPASNGSNGHSEPALLHTNGHDAGFRGWRARRAVLALGAGALTMSIVSAMTYAPGYSEVAILTPLGSGQRTAMQWIEANTPPDARFLVMPRGGWQTDKEAEWFPIIADRASVATVQGWEWVERGSFDQQVRAFDAAWDCGYKTASCLDRWISEYHRPFEYLYIPADIGMGCCSTLIESLATQSNYRLLYYGLGGSVYLRTPA